MAKYQAFFQGRETTIEAEGLYSAKQKALAFFKPRKRDEGLVAVVLVEVDGQIVTHSPGEL
jgi:hypothetical protein